MPELPEVETIKRDLEKSVVGQIVEKVSVYDQRVIRGLNLKVFTTKLQGLKIIKVSRLGKAVILSFEPAGHLVVQLKMTGQLILNGPKLKETKLTFLLSNGQYLNYNDQRIFGRLTFTQRLEDLSYLRTLGVEPLNGHFSLEWLGENLKKKKVPMKVLLMKQEFIAGIGNIYASEILFASKIHPRRPAFQLKKPEVTTLYQKIVHILKEAIEFRGTSMRNYRDVSGHKGGYINRMKVYARHNEPCLECGATIQRIVQGGRSTFFCKDCQK